MAEPDRFPARYLTPRKISTIGPNLEILEDNLGDVKERLKEGVCEQADIQKMEALLKTMDASDVLAMLFFYKYSKPGDAERIGAMLNTFIDEVFECCESEADEFIQTVLNFLDGRSDSPVYQYADAWFRTRWMIIPQICGPDDRSLG